LLVALAGAVRAVAGNLVGQSDESAVAGALAEVGARRTACLRAASRRARSAIEGDAEAGDGLEAEWLGYTAIVVQADRIVDDLRAPLPD
jgi:hypothetical protein